jgi:hypothetical protein
MSFFKNSKEFARTYGIARLVGVLFVGPFILLWIKIGLGLIALGERMTKNFEI